MHALVRFLIFHLLLSLGPNALGSGIINGKKVPAKLMQYMASVQTSNGVHICGGFLISKDFVLTAAHCDRPSLTSVVLGTHNLKKVDNHTRYEVSKCKHPNFSKVKYGNDIMLLKLLKKGGADKRIQPIRIPKTMKKVKDNSKCRVAGWGFTKTRGKTVDVLQVVDVPIVKMDSCRKEWLHIGLELPKDVICAGGYDINKGFCQGDSGGPLVCSGEAVGIVSFNMDENCDYPNIANIYVNISEHLKWINNILKKKTC